MCFNDHQECKVRPYMININNIEPLFYACIILVNIPVEVVIILMIHMLNYAFLTLLNARILKYLNLCQELMKHVMY